MSKQHHPLRLPLSLLALALLIAPQLNAADALFSSAAIGGGNNDANVGLLSTKTYFNAVNIHGGALTINGVNFAASSGGNPTGTGYSITGVPLTLGSGGTNNVTGQLGSLADNFIFNGNPGVFTLTGLTAGQTYSLAFYNRVWSGGRVQNITTTSGATTSFNQDFNAVGDLNLLRYTFTAGGTSEALNFAHTGASMHFYGFSTEQVFNNTWTSGADWTTAAWSVAQPNAVGANADFTAQGAPTTINLDAARTVGHVRFDGANAWTLSGANTLTLQADVGGVSVLGASSGTHTIATAVTLNNDLLKTGAGNLVISGAIAGSGKHVTLGAGTLTLSGANTYNGLTDITAGTLVAASNTALGVGGHNGGTMTHIRDGATLALQGGISLDEHFHVWGSGVGGLGAVRSISGNNALTNAPGGAPGYALRSNTTVAVDADTLTVSGFYNGDGGSYGIIKIGAGTLAISTSSHYTGATTISAGTLAISGGSAIVDTGAVTIADVADARLVLNASERIGSLAGGGGTGGAVQLGGHTLTVGDATSTTFAGIISGSGGGISKVGTGTLTLSGANTYNGQTNITAGTLVAASNTALGVGGHNGGTMSFIQDGATLALQGGISLDEHFHVWGSGVGGLGAVRSISGNNALTNAPGGAPGYALRTNVTVAVDADTLTVSGFYNGDAGSYGLIKIGAGTLAISATSQYTGPTMINAGKLVLNGGSGIADSSAVTIADTAGAELQLNASETVGSLAGGGATGGAVLLGANTLAAGGDGTSTTFAGIISGSGGGITKAGAGTLTLSGANTYTGLTTISGGTIVNGSASTFTNKGGLSMSGTSTFDLGGFNAGFTTSASVAGTTITNSSAATSASNATAPGTPSGAGVYVDALTISNGDQAINALLTDGPTRKTQVVINNNNSAANLGQINNSANTFSGGLVLANNGGGTRLRITTLIGSGTPFGTGPIIIGQAATDKAGILMDSVNNNTLANPIIFNTALGTDFAGGVRVDTTGNILSGKLTANLANAKFNSGGSVSLTGQVTGAFGLEHNVRAGTVTLNNAGTANDYAGDTIVGTPSVNSILALGRADQIPNGSSAGNVVVDGTLNLGGFSETINGLSGGSTGIVDGVSGTASLTVGDKDATSTFSGVIRNTAGTLALTKIGTGTLTLSGMNTHTGGTTVNAGTLAFGAVPGGPGNIRGTLNINPNATVNAGGSWNLGFTSGLSVNTINIDHGSLLFSATAFNGGTAASTITMTGGTIAGNGGGNTFDWYHGNTTTPSLITVASPDRSTISANINLRLNSAANNLTFNVGSGTTSDGIDLLVSGNITTTGGGDAQGGIIKTGAGRMVLSGANSYNGVTTIKGGVLNVASLSDYGANGSLGNRASDSGGNVGILFQGGTLQYTGSTAQSTNRAIRINADGGGGNTGGATIDASGSTPAATVSFTATSSPDLFEFGGNRTLTLTGSNTGANTFAIALHNAGGATSLVKNGPGKWVVSGASTYNGQTDITAGTLVAANNTALGVGGHNGSTMTHIRDGATLALQGGVSLDEHFHVWGAGVDGLGAVRSISGNNALTNSAPGGQPGYALRSNTTVGVDADTLTVPGFYNGDGGSYGLTKVGAGTLALTAFSTYTGPTAINAGTVSVSSNDALGSTAAGTSVASGATLELNNVNYSSAEPLSLNGAGTSGSGALKNTGTSTYAGTITAATNATINAGGGTLTTTGGLVKDGTTLTIAGGGTVIVNGTGISGSAANSDLVVDGTTLVVNAASNYNGPTTVQNSGTLVANAAVTTTKMTVTANSSLSGTSSITTAGGTDYVMLNGTLQVGDSTLGSPTASVVEFKSSGVSGSTVLTTGGSSSLYFDLFQRGGDLTATAAAADYIRLFGNFDASLGGTLYLTDSIAGAHTFAAGDQWKIFDLSSGGSITGSLSVNYTSLGLGPSLTGSFNSSTGTFSITSAIPEPSRALLLMLGVIGLFARRRRF